MLVTGEWQLRDDGVMRPIVRAKVLGVAGNLVPENFLIDSGADRTVFSATLLARMRNRSVPFLFGIQAMVPG